MMASFLRPFLLVISAVTAVIAAALLAPSIAQAGTIVVIDGTSAPVGGTYTDGWIQAQLSSGSVIIDTESVGSGPDNILVQAGAVVTWTTDSLLTLRAENNIVITGTIQHDGPANGAGGLQMAADANGNDSGMVIIGTGEQTSGVAVGSRFGLTRVDAGDLVLQGGNSGEEPFAQLGYHAVDQGADYLVSGPISVTVSHNVTATGGSANFAYVQIGHGGGDSRQEPIPSGKLNGPIAVEAGGNVLFRGGSFFAYAQMGNGGDRAFGNFGGGHTLTSGGNVIFQGGDEEEAYVQFGNGGYRVDGDQVGSHRLSASGDVIFQGGGGSENYTACSQFGNGGYGTIGNHSGNLMLEISGSLTMTKSSGSSARAMIGHGDCSSMSGQGWGSRAGDIMLRVGETGVFIGSQVGHRSDCSFSTITQGRTYIGVGQVDHYALGTVNLVAGGGADFVSASALNGGELRFYLPRQEAQQISTIATFNCERFAADNTIPWAALRGFYVYGDGPYVPKYSFYLSWLPDASIVKTVEPSGELEPGDHITYTLTFSNAGSNTTTDVVIGDTLPPALMNVSVSTLPDAGVTVTQTRSAPNLEWAVSDLSVGKGGVIKLQATVKDDLPLSETIIINTATITATGDITSTNNIASVTSVAAGAERLCLPTMVKQ